MIEIKTRLRKWGNSLGIVVPKNTVKDSHLEEGEEVTALLVKEDKKINILKEMFGSLKFKKPIAQIMREIDEELDSEF